MKALILTFFGLIMIFWFSCKDKANLDISKGLSLVSSSSDAYQESPVGDSLIIELKNLDNVIIEYADVEFYRSKFDDRGNLIWTAEFAFETFYDIGFNETFRFVHYVADTTSITDYENQGLTDAINVRYKHKGGGFSTIHIGIKLF